MKVKFEIEFNDGEKIALEDEHVNEDDAVEFFKRFAPYRSDDEAERAAMLFESQGRSAKDFVKEGFRYTASDLIEDYWFYHLAGNLAEIGWDVDQDFSNWQK